jgi:hypothetical protein
MENHHAIKNGKPSISMGHGFHGKLLVITRGFLAIEIVGKFPLTISNPKKPMVSQLLMVNPWG